MPKRSLSLELLEPRRLLSRSTISALVSSAPSVSVGTPVTFTDTVTSTAGVPTGSVEFLADGKILSIVQLRDGSASVTDSNLSIGKHTIIAEFMPPRGTVWGPSNTTISETITTIPPVNPPPVNPPPVNPPPVNPPPTNPPPTNPPPTNPPTTGQSLQLAAVAYQDTVTSQQATWNEANIQYFAGPYQQYAAEYTAAGDQATLYDNYYCMYVGGAKYDAMVQWCTTNKVTLESMFLHFATATTVTLDGETATLQAGSRVPTYDWGAAVGDLTATGARVVMNAGSVNYQRFNVWWEQQSLAAADGAYTGIFDDNATANVLLENSGLPATARFAEYPTAANLATAVTQYEASLVQCEAAVAAAGIKQTINVGNEAVDPASLPYVKDVFMEFVLEPPNNDTYWYQFLAQQISQDNAAGVGVIVSTYYTTTAAEQLDALANYYAVASPTLDYLCVQNSNDGTIQTDNYFGAESVNIGTPLGAATVVASGVDSLGNPWQIYERKFGDGIVLYRPYAEYNGAGNLSAVTVSLGGSYRIVNADGSLGANVSSVSVGDGQGVVLQG